MKSTKRAERRHHRARMSARARRIGRVVRGMKGGELDRWVLQSFNNLQVCSCWMCGNPRRYFGDPTLRERRFAQESSTSTRFDF